MVFICNAGEGIVVSARRGKTGSHITAAALLASASLIASYAVHAGDLEGVDSLNNTGPQPAQTAANASASAPGTGLAEITITAERYRSTVESTPASITAITGDELQLSGESDVLSVAQTVPGLSMNSDGPGQTQFNMRGLSSSGGNSSVVGFYLDDVPLTAPLADFNGKVVIDPNLYDLQQVVVLRGPQGTLYGSGSMGGTIKLVTNPPDLQSFEASGESIGSNTDGGAFNYTENGMVNIPFANGTAALRLVGTVSHTSGWLNRIVIANGDFPLETNGNNTRGDVLAAPVAADYEDANDTDELEGRATLLWHPTDRLSVTAEAFYQRLTQGDLDLIDVPPPLSDNFYEPFNVPQGQRQAFMLGLITVEYHFHGFDLTSTTSHWIRPEKIFGDATEELQWALSSPTAPFPFYTSQGGLGPNSPPFLEQDGSYQTSEEVRLSSNNTASRFKWLIGYFYDDMSSTTTLDWVFPGAVPVFGTSNLFSLNQPAKLLQNAVFGQVSYQLTSSLTATAGLRRYTFSMPLQNTEGGVLSPSGSGASNTTFDYEHAEGLIPSFNLSYAPNKSHLLYATAAEGFRPGGGFQTIPTTGSLGDTCEAELQANHGATAFVAAPDTYGPDDIWSYEFGDKFEPTGHRLMINADVYYENWQKVQQNVGLGCGFDYIANLGTAHVEGSEVDIHALLLPGLILAANASYDHSYFAVANMEAGEAAGAPVLGVPEWSSSVSLSYQHPISDNLRLVGFIGNTYTGPTTNLQYISYMQFPAYDLTNLRIGIGGGRWTATVFAQNLLNKEVILGPGGGVAALSVSTWIPYEVSQPRTVGLDLSYQFGGG